MTTENTQNELLMNSLMEFYKNKERLTRMVSIINGETKISLRIVDWFVTNYAKKQYTMYDIETDDNFGGSPETIRFKVYNDYKLKLKAYSKKRFDPFCRWERTMIPLENDKCIETTIGQLNFFKWAIENNVLDYIEENYDDIDGDMNTRNNTYKRKHGKTNSSNASSASSMSSVSTVSTDDGTVETDEDEPPTTNGGNKTRKKREELSVSACKCIKKESVKIIVKFH